MVPAELKPSAGGDGAWAVTGHLARVAGGTDSAAGNMAVDGLMLATVARDGASFRHYGWQGHCVTFGYAQPFEAVAREAPASADLCRRPTGGGMVDHADDWTYALAIGRGHPAARAPARALYRELHLRLAAALRALGAEAGIAPEAGPTARPLTQGRPSACFARPAGSDVIDAGGRKVAGAALKRTRRGLLVQGSVDPGALGEPFPRERLEERLLRELARWLRLPPGLPRAAAELFPAAALAEARRTFASAGWNRRR